MTTMNLTKSQSRDIATTIMGWPSSLWMECGTPDWTLDKLYGDKFPHPLPGPAKQTMLEHSIEAIEAWSPIAARVIVTTRRNAFEAVLLAIFDAVGDHMSIVPSLHPSDYIPKDDPDWLVNQDVWAELAEDGEKACRITGASSVLIDAEHPMTPWYQLKYVPDYTRLREAMTPLRESHLTWVFYPFGPYSMALPIETGMAMMSYIRDAVPGARFTSCADNWPRDMTDSRAIQQQAAQRMVVDDGEIEHHIFVTDIGEYIYTSGMKNRNPCYSPATAVEWAQQHAFTSINWYPGFYSLKATGEAMTKYLLPSGAVVAA